MDGCVFCKIISNQIPCFKIWENENYLAFLDIDPSVRGMTIIVPKEHQDSYIYNLSDEQIACVVQAGKQVAKLLEKKLAVTRVVTVIEGLQVPHLHLKLYPYYPLKGQYTKPTPKELEELAKVIRE
jgi:histidine triad (HIT) family protein